MKIGILGTGNMGRTLGTRWARLGHEVLFGSSDSAKAEKTARDASASARSGDPDAAAAFGDVVLYTARGVRPSKWLREPSRLAGKVVIDCNNSDEDPARPGEFLPAPVPSYAEQLAADVAGARVVQAFSTLPHQVLELDTALLAPHGVSAFVCSDDAGAKAIVMGLAGELGLAPIDGGELRHARLVDGVTSFLRFHIAARGLGPFTTVSLRRLETPR